MSIIADYRIKKEVKYGNPFQKGRISTEFFKKMFDNCGFVDQTKDIGTSFKTFNGDQFIPDFVLHDCIAQFDLLIECKNTSSDDRIVRLSNNQFVGYPNYFGDKNISILMVSYGDPFHPEECYMIPINVINQLSVRLDDFQEYRIPVDSYFFNIYDVCGSAKIQIRI